MSYRIEQRYGSPYKPSRQRKVSETRAPAGSVEWTTGVIIDDLHPMPAWMGGWAAGIAFAAAHLESQRQVDLRIRRQEQREQRWRDMEAERLNRNYGGAW